MAIYRKILNAFPVENNLSTLLSRNNLLNRQSCVSVSYKLVEKNLGLPPKPKRPMTPFLQYAQTERPLLQTQHPEKSLMNISRILSEKWQHVSDSEKQQLRKLCKEEMDKYTEELMKYENNLSEEQKELIKAERSRLRQKKEKIEMKKKLQELGRPKKPATPFVTFMISKLSSKPVGIPQKEWLGVLGKEWNLLPASEKIPILEESRKLMTQYASDVLAWEAKMLKMGHIDVVRTRALLGLKNRSETENAENSSREQE